jgi:ParB/RepB/Spo0J family partition protein
MDTAITQTLTHLSLGALAPSSTAVQAKRRKRYDKAALAELADSIRQSGVIQPIVARTLDAEHFEIVAGERRWLSAKAAGLPTIPTVVRSLTDTEVLTVQLVENLKREELHPLEEAEGYEELMRHGLTIEALMQKVGKKASSRAYVYGRLKLCALSPASREAFYDGKLTASTALLIARVPGAKLQAEALAEITAPRFGNEPLSAREAATHIQERYMLRLADAPFDRKDWHWCRRPAPAARVRSAPATSRNYSATYAVQTSARTRRVSRRSARPRWHAARLRRRRKAFR